ncbi:hypothetical protein V6N12_022489 [Hibiscus sabdariffa]|uniref:Uncharacterized protein n=1 Tax=Hibiscus sabdariffa TaxID=183260 RepID=A0ABR2FUV4_9ROSI
MKESESLKLIVLYNLYGCSITPLHTSSYSSGSAYGEARHCKASSRIFSRAKLVTAVGSSRGSKAEMATPSVNFFIACNCKTR